MMPRREACTAPDTGHPGIALGTQRHAGAPALGDHRPHPLEPPGYSRQNLRKSDCSSFRAFRNILPFSVPTTKALSSCTATQATSAFSLDSAEHCGREQGV